MENCLLSEDDRLYDGVNMCDDRLRKLLDSY